MSDQNIGRLDSQVINVDSFFNRMKLSAAILINLFKVNQDLKKTYKLIICVFLQTLNFEFMIQILKYYIFRFEEILFIFLFVAYLLFIYVHICV